MPKKSDECIYKTKTDYSLKLLLKFNADSTYLSLGTILGVILALILIALSIVISSESFDIYLKIFTIIIASLYILFTAFMPVFSAIKEYKSSSVMEGATTYVSFFKGKIRVETFKAEKQISKNILKYEDIYRFIDKKDMMYIYVSQTQVLLCSKKDFEGNYQELLQLLVEKLGKKYKSKNKKYKSKNKK